MPDDTHVEVYLGLEFVVNDAGEVLAIVDPKADPQWRFVDIVDEGLNLPDD